MDALDSLLADSKPGANFIGPDQLGTVAPPTRANPQGKERDALDALLATPEPAPSPSAGETLGDIASSIGYGVSNLPNVGANLIEKVAPLPSSAPVTRADIARDEFQKAAQTADVSNPQAGLQIAQGIAQQLHTTPAAVVSANQPAPIDYRNLNPNGPAGAALAALETASRGVAKTPLDVTAGALSLADLLGLNHPQDTIFAGEQSADQDAATRAAESAHPVTTGGTGIATNLATFAAMPEADLGKLTVKAEQFAAEHPGAAGKLTQYLARALSNAPRATVAGGIPQGEDAAQQTLANGGTLPQALGEAAANTGLGTLAFELPASLGGPAPARAVGGAALQAGANYGQQAASHAIAPQVFPAAQVSPEAAGLGALFALLGGHGQAPRAEAPRAAESVPELDSIAAKMRAELKAHGLSDAQIDAILNPAPEPATPALPAPVVHVDTAGNAATQAQADAARRAAEALGLTPDVLKAQAARATGVESTVHSPTPAPREPLGLPAPVVAVERRSELGLTPDVERAQTARNAPELARQAQERINPSAATIDDMLAEVEGLQHAPEGAPAPDHGAAEPAPEKVDTYFANLPKEIGWEQRGGGIIRAPSGHEGTYAERNEGEVTGRMPWIPRIGGDGTPSAFWRMRPDRSLTEAQAHEAFRKVAAGEPLRPIEQRFIDYARQTAHDYAQAEAEETARFEAEQNEADDLERQRAIDELRNESARFATADHGEAFTIAQWMRRAHDAGVPRELVGAAMNHDDWTQRLAALIREQEHGADQGTTVVGDERGVPPDRQGQAPVVRESESAPAGEGQRSAAPADLFPAATAREQVAAAERAKDEARNGNTGRVIPGFEGTDLGATPHGEAPEQARIPEATEPRRFATQKEAGMYAATLRGDARVHRVIGDDGKPAWEVRQRASSDAFADGATIGTPKRSASDAQESQSGVPEGLPVEQTDATRRLAKALNRDIRSGKDQGTPARFREIRPDSLPDALHQALRALERFGNLKVHVIRNINADETGVRFNGVSMGDGHLYVDEHAEYPAVTVASHEFLHQLRNDAPDLYGELHAEVERQISEGTTGKWGDWIAEAARRGYKHHEMPEELVADATGDALTDPEFLNRMAERNPSAFRDLATRFIDFFNRLLGHARELGSNQYLYDVAAFRDKLADVLDRFASERVQDISMPRRGTLEVKPGEPDYSRVAQTESPEFRKFFGDSKVVDDRGEPLPVYHGTAEGFTVFDDKRAGESTAHMTAPLGHFFAEDAAKAQRYAENASRGVPADERVVDAYLNIRKPFEMSTDDLLKIESQDEARSMKRQLEGQGFDGIHITDAHQWVAFNPEQIKSASENRGTFSPNNPDIRFSRRAGEQDESQERAGEMGHGASGPAPAGATGVKNEQVKAERAARGLDELDVEGRRSFGTVWDNAEAKLRDDPHAGQALAQHIIDKPRALSAEETAILTQDRARIALQRRAAAEDVNKAVGAGDVAGEAIARAKLKLANDEMDVSDKAARASGYEQGLGLAIRAKMQSLDYSLDGMEQRLAAAKGRPLDERDLKALRDLHEQMQAKDAELAGRTEAKQARQKETKAKLQEQLRLFNDQLDQAESRRDSVRQKQLRKQIAELARRIVEGDYSKAQRTPIQYNEDTNRLLAERNFLRKKFDRLAAQAEYNNKSRAYKALSTFLALRRAIILSGFTTLFKLSAAASYRIGLSPVEHGIQGALGKLPGLRGVAEKAPLEGRFSGAAERGALGQTFNKQTLRDMRDKFLHGENMNDLLYGKNKAALHSWLDMVGHVHAALKTPAERNAFARAKTMGAEFEAKRAAESGMTPEQVVAHMESPVTQGVINMRAYEESQRAVFKNKNAMVKGFDSLKRSIPSIAPVLDYIFPIVNVPSNYLGEAMSYAGGAAKAAKVLMDAKGVQKLTADQADYIMRALGKQTIGVALGAVGWLFYKQIGSFYQTGDNKRKVPEEGTAFGFPKWALDTPAAMMLTIGANLHRISDGIHSQDGSIRKGTGTPGNAVLNTARGVWDEIPFVREPQQLSSEFRSTDALTQAVGNEAAHNFIPPDVRKLAAHLDHHTPRKPKSFAQEIEMSVPGLRQKVPRKH